MKNIKLISLCLVFFLIFGGMLSAQKTAAEKEKARQLYEQAKKLIYKKNYVLAVDALKQVMKN